MSTGLKPFDFITNKYAKKVLDSGLENYSLYSGINNGSTNEIKTNFEMTDSETVINSPTSNALIILGRDRNAGPSSGMGGKGYTGAASVDIVAGLMGQWPVDTLFSQRAPASKDFKNDAARIYLSQMSDVDTYFEIPKVQAKLGEVTLDLEHGVGLSTVAVKADAVRLIARENIKLVTFHKNITSANISATNGGIDIVAGCNMMGVDKNLQLHPMVRGNNLIKLLKEIVNRIDDVYATMSKFMKTQREINDIMTKHTHQSNKAGLATSSIIGNSASMKNFKLLTDVLPNIIDAFIYNNSIEGSYFTPMSEKYINSIWNRVN